MFINLLTFWQIILLIFGLAVFSWISWRRQDLGAALVVFLAPLYLLKIGQLPLTVLECLIWIFIIEYLIKNFLSEDEIYDFWLKIKDSLDKKYLVATSLILIGMILAIFFSPDIKTGLGIFKSWFLAPMIFSLILFSDKEINKKIPFAMSASGILVAGIALTYLIFGQMTYDGRLKAFYLSPNHLAMYLAPAFLMALAFWFEIKKFWQKIFLFLASCFLLFILYFTYSYGAWLGLLAALIFVAIFLWQRELWDKRKLFLIFCLLFIVFLLIAASQLDSAKLNNLLISDHSSWQSRLMVWRSAGEILKDHWVLGIGPGLFQQYYLEYQKYFPVPYLEWAVPQPHNLFLAFWLQAGLLGLIGFLWLVIIFFQQTIDFLKSFKGADKKQPLVIFLAAVLIYILVHGLIDTTFWKNDLALIFWVIVFLNSKAAHLGD
jgi:O-antigen ligase